MRSLRCNILSDCPATRQTFSTGGNNTISDTELLSSITSTLYNLKPYNKKDKIKNDEIRR